MSFEASSHARSWLVSWEQYKILRSLANERKLDTVAYTVPNPNELDTYRRDGPTIPNVIIEQDEEVVKYFCGIIQAQFGTIKKTATNESSLSRKHHWRVVATAIAFFRRFYLNNSLLVHDPRLVMLASVFLASKIEESVESHISFRELKAAYVNATPESIKTHELSLLQALNFDLQVYHPQNCVPTLILDFRGCLPPLIPPQKPLDDGTEAGALVGSAWVEYVRHTQSVSSKQWATAAEEVLMDLQLSNAVMRFTPTVIAISALKTTEPAGVFSLSFDAYLLTRFGSIVGAEFVSLANEVTALLPAARAVVDPKYFKHVCMERLKRDSLWSKKKAPKSSSSSASSSSTVAKDTNNSTAATAAAAVVVSTASSGSAIRVKKEGSGNAIKEETSNRQQQQQQQTSTSSVVIKAENASSRTVPMELS